MFCDKCGNKIADNAKFCPYCGNQMKQPQVPFNAPPRTGGYQPAADFNMPDDTFDMPAAPRTDKGPKFKQPKKSHTGLIAGIIGGVAALVIVAVVLVLVLGGSPTAKVGKAMMSTYNAYSGMLKELPVAKSVDLISDGAFTQTMQLEMKELYDADYDVSGLGFAMSAGVDLKGRQAMVDFNGFYGSVGLLNADLIMDDDIISVACPEILGNDRYGVNTMEIGDGLAAMEPELEGVGFNVFEMAEIYQNFMKENADLSKEYSKCFKDLMKAAEIEKDGKKKMDVNGERMECVRYEVVLPEDALLDFTDRVCETMVQVDYMGLAEQLVTAMNLPADLENDVLDEVQMELEYSVPDPDELYENLEYLIEELGGLEFEVYVNKGKVAALIWEYEDEGVSLELYFGGPGAYEDDLSLVISDGYDTVSISSSGSHTGKGGVYTDKTILYDGYSELISELYYEPNADSDNFAWEIYEDGGTGFYAEGTLITDGKACTLSLDSVELQEWDTPVMEFALDFSITEFQKLPKTEDAIMIQDMSESEIEELSMAVEENAMYWMMDLLEQVPELGLY